MNVRVNEGTMAVGGETVQERDVDQTPQQQRIWRLAHTWHCTRTAHELHMNCARTARADQSLRIIGFAINCSPRPLNSADRKPSSARIDVCFRRRFRSLPENVRPSTIS